MKFLLDFVRNGAGNPTTSARLTSSDAFNIAEFIQQSELLVDSTGSEPVPAGSLPERLEVTDLSDRYYELLVEFYKKMAYPTQSFARFHEVVPVAAVTVSNEIEKFYTLTLRGQLYRSAQARTQRGSHIQALFLDERSSEVRAYPGQIQYFFRHKLRSVGGADIIHTFAFVVGISLTSGNLSSKSTSRYGWTVSITSIIIAYYRFNGSIPLWQLPSSVYAVEDSS